MKNNENKDTNLMPLEDVHTLLLYILAFINKISENENIPIFSHGGTTLGAVRHKGFIPWDDDIDLIMERKYYHDFVKACNKYLPDILTVRTRENDPYFCEEYIKVCYKDEEKKYSDLAVDIFILDKTDPNKKIMRWLQNNIIKWVRPIKFYKTTKEVKYLTPYIPKNKIKHIVLKLFSRLSLEQLTNIQTKAMLAEKKDTGWLVDWGSISLYTLATWDKTWYSKCIKLPFENLYVYTSDHYLDILERGYGKDFMQLPPIDKRKTHNVERIANPNINIIKISEYLSKIKQSNY